MIAEKLVELTRKRHALIESMVVPARAAANQMKDAGMNRGADPLMQILFEIEACEQEVAKLYADDPKAALTALVDLMKRGRP